MAESRAVARRYRWLQGRRVVQTDGKSTQSAPHASGDDLRDIDMVSVAVELGSCQMKGSFRSFSCLDRQEMHRLGRLSLGRKPTENLS